MRPEYKFEENVTKLLQKKGINASVGYHLFYPEMIKSKENYLQIIKDNDIDGVLTMALVESEEAIEYEAGEVQYIPSSYRYYGRFAVQRYTRVYTPGKFSTSKSYLIEAVLHDLKGDFEGTETIAWTGQSTLVDPSSIDVAADDFSRTLVMHLTKNDIVEGNK